MKTKQTLISSDDKKMTVSIHISEGDDCKETYVFQMPFNIIPPQIAHQIASHLAMCNSYYVEDAESGTKVADNR